MKTSTKWILGIALAIVILFLISPKQESGEKKMPSKEEISSSPKKEKKLNDSLSKWRKTLKVEKDEMNNGLFLFDKSTSSYTNINQVAAYIGFATQKDSIVSRPSLQFKLNYHADHWLFMQDAIFKIDDNEPIKIGLYNVKRENEGRKVWEYIDASADNNMYYQVLKSIASAKTVKMRINGKDRYEERNLTAAEIKAIKNIMTAYESMQ